MIMIIIIVTTTSDLQPIASTAILNQYLSSQFPQKFILNSILLQLQDIASYA